MEKRWNVYHGNDCLGLKSAREIRDALRQGTLDPFDKVSSEGSNIREDLIEVDEIFRDSGEGPAPSPSPTKRAEEAPDPGATVVADRSVMAEALQLHNATSIAEKPQPADANPPVTENAMDFSQRNDSGIRQTGKRYYLIEGEKILGPLSALEIQSLFTRNMLNKKVRVQKIGGEKTLPITQFIADYSGDRLKELAGDGRIPQQIGVGSPSSKVMNELVRMAKSRRVAQNRKNQAYLVMALVGLIVGALVFVLFERSTRQPVKHPAIEQEANEQTPAGKPRPRLIQKPPESPPRREAPAPVGRPLDRPSPRPARQVESRSIKQAAPVRAPQLQQPSTATPATQKGPIAKAMESAGRVQTIGPLTFSSAALESCQKKCVLTLFDGRGARMKAVFFKNAYSDQLRNRARGVFLTGNTKLERGELTLFIQAVR